MDDQNHIVGQLLEISNRLLTSDYLFDRKTVWQTITREICKLYDCELVSLFLVDEDNPDSLRSVEGHPQNPANSNVCVPIVSSPGGGITSHAAASGETLLLNMQDIKTNQYIKNRTPSYLSSGLCYSALFEPLKNRKGRLIGLIRLNNKNITDSNKLEGFTSTDVTILKNLTTQIVALHENAQASESLRLVVEEILKSSTTQQAVKCILTHGLRLMSADVASLYLWSKSKNQLVLVGTKNYHTTTDANGTEERCPNIVNTVWKDAVHSSQAGGQASDQPRVQASLDASDATGYHPNSKSTITILLRAHDQPVGVLHFELFQPDGFDKLDKRFVGTLAQNIATAVQAANQPWSIHRDSLDGQSDEASLGQAEGLFRSLVNHIPFVMWRKDVQGRFLWVNDAFCISVGKKRSEILGKVDTDLFLPGLAKKFQDGDRRAQVDGGFEDDEEHYMLPDGSKRFIHVIKRAYHDVLDSVAGTQGIFLDVTGEKYRQLFDQAPIGTHELDAQGNILRINQFALNLLGYTLQEVQYQPFHRFVREDQQAELQEWIEKHVTGQGRENDSYPINLQTKLQVILPALLHSRRRINTEGSGTGLLCTIQEFSAGEEIADALHEPDSRYLARIKELELPVFCIDTDFKITYANPAYLKKDEFESLEQILGKTGPELYGELGKSYQLDSRRVIKDECVLDQFERHLDNNKNPVLVRVLKFPIRDSNGKITGVQGVFWDRDKQAEAKRLLSDALTAAMQEYRNIILHASEGIFQSTLDGTIIAANPAMCKLLGYATESELLQNSRAGIVRFADSAELGNYYRSILGSPADTNQPKRFQYQLRKKDGSVISVAESIQKAYNNSKVQNNRLIGFVEDITERLRREEEIQNSLRRKQDMLTMLAHQLRSPVWQAYERTLSLVHDMDPNGLLATGKAPQSVHRLATVRGLVRKTRAVAWSIDMMSKLAQNDTVDLTKRQSFHPSRLKKIATEVARDLQLIRRSSSRLGRTSPVPEFQIEYVDNPFLSKLKLSGDIDLLEQCIGNIIENAFKYSVPTSTIEIECFVGYTQTIFSVRNCPLPGLEVDAEIIEKCRTKEWRGPGATSVDADGTGLGLWFADRIMQAHNGKLDILPIRNGWNTFQLVFQSSR